MKRVGAVVVAVACVSLLPALPAGSVEEPVPVLRIDAGGAGVAGSPAWQADTAQRAEPARQRRGGWCGPGPVFSRPGCSPTPSVPAGTPATVVQTVRADLEGGRPQPDLQAPGFAGTGTAPPVLRRSRRLDHRRRPWCVRRSRRGCAGRRRPGCGRPDRRRAAGVGAHVRRGGLGPMADVVLRWKVKPPAIAGLELLEAPPTAPA